MDMISKEFLRAGGEEVTYVFQFNMHKPFTNMTVTSIQFTGL